MGFVAQDPDRPMLVFEYCSEGDLLRWLRRKAQVNDAPVGIRELLH